MALFTDHAVLQCDAVVPVWGVAEADEPVTVSFGDQKCETRADSQGGWRVDLHPMPESATPREMTIAGNLKDMFLHLTPANDLQFQYGVDAPTLRIEGMTVAGL